MSHQQIAPEQSECLLRIVEAAPQVRRRHQFFMWSQGDLQRWLPHKISVCGAYDREQRDLVFDIFNSIPVPPDVIEGLKDGRSEIISVAMQTWKRTRQQPCRLVLADVVGANPVWLALRELGFLELLMHGVTRPGRPDEVESFFLFAQPERPYGEAALAALEMLLPCMHLTYQRVCVTERQLVPVRTHMHPVLVNPYQRVTPITEREREILLWVRDGLSNQQISEKLGISALTVKNHV
ncbi:MAG TPA: LuxR C-terminal-related transcriptional regulator, partial [Aquabacterium sp.]|nr:LuxR C-terminal-related transcriptional regulator [Aquabacterium sp.]